MNPGYHRILGALRDLRTDWRWWFSFVLPVRMVSTYEVVRPVAGVSDGITVKTVTERATWWQWRGRVFARAVEVIDV